MAASKKRSVLIDSNIVFGFLNGDKSVEEELERIGEENLFASVVVMAECMTTRNKESLNKTKLFLERLTIIQIDTNISKRFGSLMASHAPRTRWIPDALIAATALENGYQLYTLNRKDFEFISELKLYNPKAFTQALHP